MNPMNPMNGSYGVPRDVYSKVKQAGLVMLDVAIIFVTTMIGGGIAFNVFPMNQPLQMLAFIFMTFVISVYLLLPTNGDKKNWQSLYLAVKRRKRRYISFDFIEED